MEQPGNASLLEMWHEQMQVRTLHEQNQHLLDLVKRVSTKLRSRRPAVRMHRVFGVRELHPVIRFVLGFLGARQGSVGSVASRSRCQWRIFSQDVCFRAWCSLHGVGNSRISKILTAAASGRNMPFDDARKLSHPKDQVQRDCCIQLEQIVFQARRVLGMLHWFCQTRSEVMLSWSSCTIMLRNHWPPRTCWPTSCRLRSGWACVVGGQQRAVQALPFHIPPRQEETKQQCLPAEWQFENPVARAAVGVDGRRETRKDICWLPPGTVTDLFEQFKAGLPLARCVAALSRPSRAPAEVTYVGVSDAELPSYATFRRVFKERWASCMRFRGESQHSRCATCVWRLISPGG